MKSTDWFQSAPNVVGLFSAMLWIYYALLKSNVLLLITINSVGCFIETLYISPLGVLRQVVKTKSVEYMPILLSVALTLNAVMWFFYGLLLGDFNIASSDVLLAVAKLKENEHDIVPVAVEPHARPNVPNHIIEVAV
ncbi:hypothetical protein L6452_07409 [Arctium lappa]|uniref:Uncharacterized protein n=1 Tax=Arctium lappa TaxID=4217 RepID=A0ACB9EL43_ARCLA|nr:hypothetical protein L6452_07409 [Arctium lappa]